MEQSQPETARRMYNARAQKYDDSHHPAFASYYVEYLDVQPGWHVLDLASGTGLVTFAAARAVGPTGSVIGIDVSDGMQAVAIQELSRLQAQDGGWENVTFYNHDVTKLDELDAIRDRKFDAITCCSTLVLLDEPYQAVTSWTAFLKPGGTLVVDATHPQNLAAGWALEAVHARLQLPPPYSRMWSRSEQDLKGLLEAAALRVDDVHFQRQHLQAVGEFRIEDGESVWNDVIEKEQASLLRGDEVVHVAKRMFLEEWKLMADENGLIKEVDGVFIAKATKLDDKPSPEPLMTGSCACGKVTWKAATTPVAICHCFCVPCRKVSGSPFLTMMELPVWALSFEPAYPKLKSIALTPHARRSFCDTCGTTLTFQHFRSLNRLEAAMGTLDEDSLKDISIEELVKSSQRNNWCWMKSKVGWFDPPDDGWEKCETMTSLAPITAYSDDNK